jgi:hypothetical protein
MALLSGTDLPIGFMDYDGSDARGFNADGGPGSGVGFGKAPSDSREAGDGDDYPDIDHAHYSVMQTGNRPGHIDPSDRRFENGDGGPGSGGMEGAPLLTYPETTTGYDPVANGPIDGGMPDPIRRGDTPARPPIGRFRFETEPVHYEIRGEFGQPRALVGEDYRGAQQPPGRMNPMDEYRLLSDGSHA